MKRLNTFLVKQLPLFIIITGIGTYLSPIYWQAASWVPSGILGAVIFFAGLSIDLNTIKNIHLKKRELILITAFKWALTVFVSLAIAFLFLGYNEEIAAGILLSGTVPSGTAATLYTFLAGGNTALVIAASFLDIAISPVITPLSMLVLTGSQITITFFSLLKSFLIIVAIPLGSGLALKHIFPKTAQHASDMTRLGSSLSLLLIVHTIVGRGSEAISMQLKFLPILSLAVLFQVVFPMLMAYWLAKKLAICEEDARAFLFQVGICNTALAAILAVQFISELAAIAPILGMVINLSVGAYFANLFVKKDL